jgi:hypothetical protein
MRTSSDGGGRRRRRPAPRPPERSLEVSLHPSPQALQPGPQPEPPGPSVGVGSLKATGPSDAPWNRSDSRLLSAASRRGGGVFPPPPRSSSTPATAVLKHIYCLEGDWWGDPRQPSTVRPIFELLAQAYPSLRYVHRSIGTREEFDHALDGWTQRKHAEFSILYLAFHGNPNLLFVGDRRRSKGRVTLEAVADRLEGRCKDRLIHFGSCKTLHCSPRNLGTFLKRTKALAVSGYRTDINWLLSASFEVYLLGAMQEGLLNVRGAREIVDRVHRVSRPLARQLGFRMVIREPRT